MKKPSLLDHSKTRLLSYNLKTMHGGKSVQTATFPQAERSFHLALDCFRNCRTAPGTERETRTPDMERLQKCFVPIDAE